MMPVRTVLQLSLQVESMLNRFFFESYTLEVLARYEWALYVGPLGANLCSCRKSLSHTLLFQLGVLHNS
jgi:hypothetical protein